MFIPEVLKYRKKFRRLFKVREKGISKAQSYLFNNRWGIKAMESFLMSPEQLETCRRLIKKILGRKAIFRVPIFFNVSLTKKPNEVRMGKGKGNIYKWIFPIRKGRILFEFKTLRKMTAKRLVVNLKFKLPIPIRLVYKK